MAKKSPKQKTNDSTIARNKKARYDFAIKDKYETGIVLQGWEVKSLRAGKCQLNDSYVILQNGEAYLVGTHITPLLSASTHISPENMRSRKLLLHRRELDKLIGQVERKGFTIIPLALYWKKGRAKLEIATAKGKQDHDKRATEKDRDWKRDKERIMKHAVK